MTSRNFIAFAVMVAASVYAAARPVSAHHSFSAEFDEPIRMAVSAADGEVAA